MFEPQPSQVSVDISAAGNRMTGSLNLSIHVHALGSGDGLIRIYFSIRRSDQVFGLTYINSLKIHGIHLQ